MVSPCGRLAQRDSKTKRLGPVKGLQRPLLTIARRRELAESGLETSGQYANSDLHLFPLWLTSDLPEDHLRIHPMGIQEYPPTKRAWCCPIF